MHVFDAIESRRSIKQFDPAHRMTDAELRKLMELAMLSPTAFNIQNWRFVVVRDPGLRQQIREVAWNQAQVTDASALIVVCADLKAWEKDPARYWRNAAPETQQVLVGMIDAYYRDKDQVQRDEAMRSCGIAAQTIMLAAKAMGYDTCPMDGFDFDAVAKLVHLPADHVISMMIAVGKAAAPAWPRSGPIAYEEAVITDRFA
ncbi:MAG: nitroreductase family protein [Candidatus Hydrogenedentes bacterium]|nr:nitroreductase family protein [Candidatus Hydrogenedentota bacterium]